jgi:hypothetical protein
MALVAVGARGDPRPPERREELSREFERSGLSATKFAVLVPLTALDGVQVPDDQFYSQGVSAALLCAGLDNGTKFCRSAV